jgi:hypothetical protein
MEQKINHWRCKQSVLKPIKRQAKYSYCPQSLYKPKRENVKSAALTEWLWWIENSNQPETYIASRYASLLNSLPQPAASASWNDTRTSRDNIRQINASQVQKSSGKRAKPTRRKNNTKQKQW